MVSECLKNIDVVVLAGGLGTRVSDQLRGTPKLLAPIGERSYLMFLLAWLKYFGARRVVFGLGHLAGTVLDYLDDIDPKGIKISAVVEDSQMGTAGAIANLRSLVKTNPVLIMNGDSFVDADLSKFVAFHGHNKASVSILCTEVLDSGRYGTVKIDKKNRVIEFKEKSANGGKGVINAGVYLFDNELLSEISKNGPSLENNFFPKQATSRLMAMSGQYDFLDIGTPADLARAPEILGKYYM